MNGICNKEKSATMLCNAANYRDTYMSEYDARLVIELSPETFQTFGEFDFLDFIDNMLSEESLRRACWMADIISEEENEFWIDKDSDVEAITEILKKRGNK